LPEIERQGTRTL